MNNDTKYKLQQLDKLLYTINEIREGVSYEILHILSGRHHNKNSPELIVDKNKISKYYYEMQELSTNLPWDETTENELLQKYKEIKILSSLDNKTPEEDFNIINQFTDMFFTI